MLTINVTLHNCYFSFACQLPVTLYHPAVLTMQEHSFSMSPTIAAESKHCQCYQNESLWIKYKQNRRGGKNNFVTAIPFFFLNVCAVICTNFKDFDENYPFIKVVTMFLVSSTYLCCDNLYFSLLRHDYSCFGTVICIYWVKHFDKTAITFSSGGHFSRL